MPPQPKFGGSGGQRPPAKIEKIQKIVEKFRKQKKCFFIFPGLGSQAWVPINVMDADVDAKLHKLRAEQQQDNQDFARIKQQLGDADVPRSPRPKRWIGFKVDWVF